MSPVCMMHTYRPSPGTCLSSRCCAFPSVVSCKACAARRDVEPSTAAAKRTLSHSVAPLRRATQLHSHKGAPQVNAALSAPSAASAAAAVAADTLTLQRDGATDLGGIIPQTSAIPTGQGGYFRTGWTGDAAIGRGFHREASQFAPQAILFTPQAPPKAPVISQSQKLSVITTAREFAQATTVGASVSVEAWIVAVSISVEVSKSTEFASNGVTLNLIRTYKSEPVMIVDPLSTPADAFNATPLQLNSTARDLLMKKGPIAFHERYGTHYVAGYTLGGMFSGFYQSRFSSTSEAESAKTTISARAGALGVKVDASATVTQKIQTDTSSSSSRASYSTIGWNSGEPDGDGNIAPPKTVIDVDSLLDAANQMDIDDGLRLEAVLRSYEDIPDYRTQLCKYRNTELKRGRQPKDFKAVPKEQWQTIAQLLNEEFLCMDYLERVIDDLQLTIVKPASADDLVEYEQVVKDLHDLRKIVYLQKTAITDNFSVVGDARGRWMALAEYIEFTQACYLLPDCHHTSNQDVRNSQLDGADADVDLDLAEKGRGLANDIFMCDALQSRYDQLLERAQEFIPPPPGDDKSEKEE